MDKKWGFLETCVRRTGPSPCSFQKACPRIESCVSEMPLKCGLCRVMLQTKRPGRNGANLGSSTIVTIKLGFGD
jgi:hypothetical protein